MRCAIHEAGGQPYYQIEDPLNSNFYRLGAREWAIARQLDGKSTLKEVVEHVVAALENDNLVKSFPLARDLVYTVLRNDFPCELKD